MLRRGPRLSRRTLSHEAREPARREPGLHPGPAAETALPRVGRPESRRGTSGLPPAPEPAPKSSGNCPPRAASTCPRGRGADSSRTRPQGAAANLAGSERNRGAGGSAASWGEAREARGPEEEQSPCPCPRRTKSSVLGSRGWHPARALDGDPRPWGSGGLRTGRRSHSSSRGKGVPIGGSYRGQSFEGAAASLTSGVQRAWERAGR